MTQNQDTQFHNQGGASGKRARPRVLRKGSLLLFVALFSVVYLSGCSGVSGQNTTPPPGQSQLTANPNNIAFGNMNVGNIGTQTVILNNSGSANLTISQATVSGTGFAMNGLTVPLTLTPGQSTAFTVSFAPTAVSSATGSLSLVSNAPSSPTNIALSGTGVASVMQLSASPTSLSFGNVLLGSSSNPQTVTLTNTGNTSVNISQVNFTGGAGYSASGLTLPLTLAAGQSTGFSVIFSPAATGSSTGNASAVSNATNSPAKIVLSGAGVQPIPHSASLTWNTSTSAVAGYNVYRGAQSGGPYIKLTSSPVLLFTYVDNTVQSGQTYFYAVTAVDSNNIESVFSNEVSAVIPSP